MESLQTRFLPEFLNRIDETIVFHPLDRAQIRKIVDLQVDRLREAARAARHAAGSHRRGAATRSPADGYDPAFGARPLKRVIQQQLQNPLATELLKGEFRARAATIRIDYRDGEFTFERIDQPETAAEAVGGRK